MRNKTIESTIDKVIDNSNYPSVFKNALKQFIKNKFDNNVTETDLKRVWSLLPEETEDDK